MGNKYNYTDLAAIEFTNDDIGVALDALTDDEKTVEVASINIEYLSGAVLQTFGRLATQLDGKVNKDYRGLTVNVPKTQAALVEQAVQNLRYSSRHADIRDQRAEEQDFEPKED